MVKSPFSPGSAVSLLPVAGSISAEPNHWAAFLSYFLVSFPQFCPSCLPCTLAPSTQGLLGRGQPPLHTEQPVVPVLLSRSVANRLFSSLLQQPSKDRAKQMAQCLMNSQQLGEPVCQLGLCSACVSHVCQSWACQLEPLLLLGSHWEDEEPLLFPQTLVPKASLCSDELFPESSQVFSRTCGYGWASLCVM